MEQTVIIASKRKGHKMWEGYTQVAKPAAKAELARRRAMGRTCKVFPDINAYREDVRKRIEYGD